MARIIHDRFIPHASAVYTLELHQGAKFLGFAALPEVHSNFAVSWWLDDEAVPKANLIVFIRRQKDVIPDPFTYLGSYLDNNSGSICRSQGVHLFRAGS